MGHVGRPSNSELKRKKIKRLLKIVIPIFFVVMLVGGSLVIFNTDLSKGLGNSLMKNLATTSAVKGYYCVDNGYKLSGSDCVKTIEESPVVLGDVDLNGKITSNDLLLLQNYLDIDDAELSTIQWLAADIDKDGEPSYLDLRILSLYFEDNPTLGTYDLYYDKVGVEKLCAQGYSLKNKVCVKTISKKASTKNIIDVEISDDQNNANSVKANTTINLTTTFKVNDKNTYYFVWRTYTNGNLQNTSACKKISTNDQDVAKVKSILSMVGTRKGVFTIYGDSSCKTKINDVSTKDYKCSNCKLTVSLNSTDKDDTKVLNWVQTKKFTVKTSGSTASKYYYTWKDSTQKSASKCATLKNNMTLTLNVNSKKHGTLVVYSDGKCKTKVTSKNTSTYSLSSIIWPVTPTFKLLTHDKKVYREKHYVYGTKSEWHEGLDITVPIGTPVYAIADGTVRGTNTYSGKYSDEDYGNVIFVKTKVNGKYYSVSYAHLRDYPTKYVKVGQSIKKGQLIGYTGITGGSRIPHLHIDFTQLVNNSLVYNSLLDPLNVLPKIDYSRLKSSVNSGDYSKTQFPKSSVALFNRMMSAQNNNKTYSYKIEGVAKVKVGSIPKGATVELIKRTRDYASLVTVKYNGKTYTNLYAGNFKFVW